MARADDDSPLAHHDAAADLSGVDLILECERAASPRNPRQLDPKRWSKTAWRRYLHIAAHRASWTSSGSSDDRTRSQMPAGQEWTAGIFIADATNALGTCPLECRDHSEKTTPWPQDRDELE
jgi:hypothetical protein